MTDDSDDEPAANATETPETTETPDGTDDVNEASGPGEESVVRRERFSGGPARDFLSSLAADERIFAADVAVTRAHVVMLAEQDVLDDEDAGEILTALGAVEDAGHPELPEGEDVHEAIETAVIERIGQTGGRMHTARSRNDEVATCIRYRLREDVLETLATLVGARRELLDTAAMHADTVMPGHTHLQPAQPTTVGHWLCSYEAALARDVHRFLDAYERINRSPLGAAAFAGTPYDVDRDRTAELLGFEGLVENATDAVSTRDFLVEVNATLASLATTLSGMAEDVILFAHDGIVELDDDYASTSSIMPQKKNPDTLELVRARAGDATAALDGLLTTLKGLPRAYNRDLQRAGAHTWGSIDAVTEATDVAVGAVTTAEWFDDDLLAAAGEGFATATGVADRLAQAGVPFRTAHEVVARAGELSADPTYETLDQAAEEILDDSLSAFVDRAAVEKALDPTESVAMRDSRGGPAPVAVAEHIDRARDGLASDRTAVAERRQAIAAARETLESEVDRYV